MHSMVSNYFLFKLEIKNLFTLNFLALDENMNLKNELQNKDSIFKDFNDLAVKENLDEIDYQIILNSIF